MSACEYTNVCVCVQVDVCMCVYVLLLPLPLPPASASHACHAKNPFSKLNKTNLR